DKDLTINHFLELAKEENPYRPGTLVAPRLGYFYPTVSPPDANYLAAHPYGIILGPSLVNDVSAGREFYRVRFGATTYESIHPVQMEIINEV
ncbi:MAG: hypothetical protein NZ811_05325, partial [Gammaproteobacteria bacterium]|nr:hypothetical protein [Gammaproteobacteria bacterium]